ncbi:hypothetical protein K466DRAFT_592883, partial [Polyporus arcularius HHB13444]
MPQLRVPDVHAQVCLSTLCGCPSGLQPEEYRQHATTLESARCEDRGSSAPSIYVVPAHPAASHRTPSCIWRRLSTLRVADTAME